MNIVKLQDDLKSVPDQSLVGYVQNPTGQVPSYLALSELQRRKKMREQAGGQAQGAQPSVAEQLVAEAQPQAPQGIAGIPVSNVGSEEAYAAGGIIAFDEGGDPGRAYNRAIQGSFLGKGLGALDESAQLAPTPGNMFKRIGEYIVDTVTGQRWVQNPYTGKLVRAKDVVETPNAGALTGANAVPTTTNVTGLMSPELPATRDSSIPVEQAILTPQPAPDLSGGITTGKFKVPAVPRAPAMPAAPTMPAAGFDVKPMGYNDSIYEAAMRPEITAEEGAQRFKAALGEDPTRAKLAERAGAMEKENEAFKAQYPWMALAEAGFNMAAGTSPNALSNIAAGGMKGVAALGTGRKEARAAEEKVYDLQAKIADAERAENRAALQHGFESEERVKASNDKNKLMKAEARARVDVANKEIEVKGAQYNQKERENATDADLKRQQIQATYANINSPLNEINTIMADLRDDPNNKGRSEADLRRMAYETKAAGNILSTGLRGNTAMISDINDQIKDQQKLLANAHGTAKKAAIQAILDQLITQRDALMSGGANTTGSTGAKVVDFNSLK